MRLYGCFEAGQLDLNLYFRKDCSNQIPMRQMNDSPLIKVGRDRGFERRTDRRQCDTECRKGELRLPLTNTYHE